MSAYAETTASATSSVDRWRCAQSLQFLLQLRSEFDNLFHFALCAGFESRQFCRDLAVIEAPHSRRRDDADEESFNELHFAPPIPEIFSQDRAPTYPSITLPNNQNSGSGNCTGVCLNNGTAT